MDLFFIIMLILIIISNKVIIIIMVIIFYLPYSFIFMIKEILKIKKKSN